METKICSDCEIVKPLEDFYTRKRKYKNKEYKNHLKYCKKCQVKFHNWTKPKTSDQARKNALKFKYKLTLEEYQDLYNKQSGKCAICKTDLTKFNKRPAVDHDHQTGKIRGILCNNCNSGIGLLKDDYKICIDAAMYLKHHLDETTE